MIMRESTTLDVVRQQEEHQEDAVHCPDAKSHTEHRNDQGAESCRPGDIPDLIPPARQTLRAVEPKQTEKDVPDHGEN